MTESQAFESVGADRDSEDEDLINGPSANHNAFRESCIFNRKECEITQVEFMPINNRG